MLFELLVSHVLIGVDADVAGDLHGFLDDAARGQFRAAQERGGRGGGVGTARADGHDPFIRLDHIAGPADQVHVLGVGHQQQGFQMAQRAVGAPFLGQFHHGTRKAAVELLELGFEARKEREGIGRGPGESRQDLVVVQAAQLAGGAFQDLAAEAHLSIAGHHDLIVAANTNHHSRSNFLSHCMGNPYFTAPALNASETCFGRNKNKTRTRHGQDSGWTTIRDKGIISPNLRRVMERLFSVRFLLFLAAGFTFPQFIHSQQVTAAIQGQLMDPSGAPVPNATITAKDVDRATTFTSSTNAEGIYSLPRIPIGTYEIKAEAKGFQTAAHTAVTLEMNQIARIDFSMRLGEMTQTVEVTGAAPLLQTENTMVGTIIDSKTNEALPLATRNYVQLTLLAPGSVHPDPSTMTNGSATGGGGRPYVNGNREQANNFLLDGLDNNQVSDNLVGYTPSVDAIAEFNMITNNASAEFGNFMGGIISTTIKSGTNHYHGDAFEFFRNDVLNANSWSNNWSGSPRSKVRWNMFGATLGGPVKKDKLFFFVDYQGQRLNFPNSTGTLSVFTAAERRGDFSELLAKGIQLYNPLQLDAAGKRVAFANNQIPLSLLDPVAKNLFASAKYPLPVVPGVQNNYFNTSASHIYQDQGDVKVDYNLSDHDRISVRYSQGFLQNPSLNSFALFAPGFNDTPTYNGVVNWTRTFSPRVVNERRLGANYVQVHHGNVFGGSAGNIAQDLGIANGNDRGPGLLSLSCGGGFVSGLGNSGVQQLFADTVIQAQDGLVINMGKHIIHTGFQFMRQRINTYYSGNNGSVGLMDFSGRYTAGPDPLAAAGGGSGAGAADFFLGLPDQLGRGVSNGTWGQSSSVIAAYVQDDYKIGSNLTLNLGLRYEVHTPWVEVKDRQTNFSPISGAIQAAGSSNCIYSNCRALYNSYNAGLDFQPRIGFAYNPDMFDRKIVVRGAYTLSSYLEGTGTNLRLPLI